jgi:hypothetical protein
MAAAGLALVSAYAAARDGKVPATPVSPRKVIYQVGDISFPMHAPDSKP